MLPTVGSAHTPSLPAGFTRHTRSSESGVDGGKSENPLPSLDLLADSWVDASGSDDAPGLAPAITLDAAPATATRATRFSRRHGPVATPQVEQAQSFIVQRFQREASVRIQHNRMADVFVALHWSHFFRTLCVQLFLPIFSVYWAIRGRTAVLRFVL